MSDINIEVEKKPNIFVRIAVIAGMLIILFLIAAAVVRFVPKIISAISPANVSLTSMFNGSATSTGQNAPANNTPVNTAPAVASTSQPTNTEPSTNTGSTYTKPAPTYVYTYKTYSGPADLSISLMKVGQVSSGGSFIQTNSIQPGSRVQVQFVVANVGSGASGSWNLNAVLPTSISSERIYNSGAQPSIPAGASYQMTLAFDSYDPATAAIQITLQGSSDVNSSNNILIVPLTSNGNYNNNNSNNCYWSNGTYYCNNNGNGNYTGNSDLSVTITNVGTMDRNSGQFYYTNSLNRNDKISVQFEVKNIGGGNSGSFTFNANLPSSSNSTYSSGTQNSLSPGQTQSFTLGFDNPNTGSSNISIQLYPQSGDSNSSNNYTSRSININN